MTTYQILVIEDEPIQQMVLTEHLTTEGYGVDIAGDGKKGLESLVSNKPDLILLDVQMPVMDGFQVLETIRKNPEYDDVPVLFLTNLETQNNKVMGLESGADDYITKPFDKAELLARIRIALKRVKSSRRNDCAMEGDLANVDLIDLLRSMEIGGKTAWIRMPGIDADICFEGGNLIYSRKKGYTGVMAMARILMEAGGAFFVRFGELPANIEKEAKNLRSVLIGTLACLELGSEPGIRNAENRDETVARIRQLLRKVERHYRSEGVMEGDLCDIGLADLLQNMEQGAKTAAITLHDIDAEIYIQDGMLIQVRQGEFTGKQALIRIFFLEKGSFLVRFHDLPAKITEEPQPLTSLLMGILAKVDEIKDLLNRTQVADKYLDKGESLNQFPEIEKFSDLMPIPFVGLIVKMENDLNENLAIIVRALKNGGLKLRKPHAQT